MPLIGASGAISACLGGFVVLLKNTKINFRYFAWFLVRAWDGDFWLPAWLVISFWFLMDLISAVGSVVGPGRGGGVAFAAHVGGFIGGFLMMLAWRGVRAWAGERGEAALLNSKQNIGKHVQLVNLSDKILTTGLYFIRLQVNDHVVTSRLVINK